MRRFFNPLLFFVMHKSCRQKISLISFDIIVSRKTAFASGIFYLFYSIFYLFYNFRGWVSMSGRFFYRKRVEKRSKMCYTVMERKKRNIHI